MWVVWMCRLGVGKLYMRGSVTNVESMRGSVSYLMTAGAHNKSSNRTRMKSKASKVLNRPIQRVIREDV